MNTTQAVTTSILNVCSLSVPACSTYWSAGMFLATRAPFMCAAVHFGKHLIKRYVLRPHREGRHKRLVKVATIILDQLLPTAFYGERPCGDANVRATTFVPLVLPH